MVLNILAPKYIVLTSYIRCNYKNSKCKWTGTESHVHQRNFIIVIDDGIIPLRKVVRVEGVFGAFSGLLSVSSHPFFPLWEEKQFWASWWRILSFLLKEEVVGKREGSVATSVMPQQVFLPVPLGESFVPLNSWGGLREAGVRCRPSACYSNCVRFHTVKCPLCTRSLTSVSLNSWNIFCCR